ncbi:MAG TPA: S8 family peptidase [Stenomitos sp.]
MAKTLNALMTGAIAMSMLSLVGCGVSPAALKGTSTRTVSDRAQVYSVNGEARLVIKRRVGSQSLQVSGVRTLRTVAGLGVQVAAVRLANLDAALSALRSDPSVVYAEPSYRVKAFDLPKTSFKGLGFSVTDPMFGQQYAPQVMHAPEAWSLTRGAGVTVAVVDTGADLTHPDLQGRLVAGYDATTKGNTPKDENGHGTHVAGIIAASANNGTGVVGIAPEAKVMPVKVLSADGSGSDADVADGITWAADHGAQVLNMSLGGPGESQVLEDAVNYALKKGVAVIAAMGNDGTNEMSYPAAYPGVVAVGATDSKDQTADFSQWGEWISVAAPGVQILSTFPTYQVNLNDYGFPQSYATLDGTSMASPAVAGLAALVKARYGSLTPAQLKSRLEAGADKVAGVTAFDPHYGFGRVNALRSLQ